MNKDRLDRFELLFRAAQLHTPEDRATFLDAACTDDPALRSELEDLLKADDQAQVESFMEEPVLGWTARLLGESADGPTDRLEGRHVGPYAVLHRLADGGMGEVYLAVRERPFKQYVALKIIRRGMDTRDVVARFGVERQILAALNHPNVSRLLDGGVTEDGRPYLAMEYVEGRPITTYSDVRRLPVRERLRLFQTVCRTVSYAHQNLIIHRDLKPSNILVTEDGTVKLLDFGIAKLLNPHLSPVAMPVTRTELRMMTPEYASPEQLRGETLTTAADVYALGVILYELITGHRPFHVAGRPTREIIAVVGEEEPERPSTKVAKLERLRQPDGSEKLISPDTVCATRQATLERLKRQIRGDLDNITLMALRKEPERRYGSAELLAQDVERYLSGMPVAARPNTVTYRVRKFTSRHRAAVVAAVLVVCSLVGGLSVALWQAREAHRERERAEEALAHSETVTNFLMELFQANDPRSTRGEDVTARELLQRGVARADGLDDQPQLQAHLLDVVGRVYESLAQYETAESLLRRALRLRQESLGEKHLLVTESMTHLASLLNRRGAYEEAESLLRRAVAIQNESLDGPHPARATTLAQLGHLLPYLDKWEEAEEVRRNVVTMQRALWGSRHPMVANSIVKVGAILRARGRYDEAEVLLREAVDIYESQDEIHVDATTTLFQLAILLKHKGAYDEAEALLRRAIDLRRELEGDGDPDISSYMFELALVLHRSGKVAGVEELYRDAMAFRQRVLGDHPATVDGLIYSSTYYHERGHLATAESLLEEALSMGLRLLGPDHKVITLIRGRLEQVRTDMGRHPPFDSLLSPASVPGDDPLPPPRAR